MGDVYLAQFDPLAKYKPAFCDSPEEEFRNLGLENYHGNSPVLVESSVLSWQKLPPLTYFPTILRGPKNDILSRHSKPRLMPSQIEALIHIMQRFVGPRLPDGAKAGFFLGDSTGVGKSRVIAAVIKEMFVIGHKKAVWVSSSSQLFVDAKHELEQIWYTGKAVVQNQFAAGHKAQNQCPTSQEKQIEDGDSDSFAEGSPKPTNDEIDPLANLVFTAYSMLRSANQIRFDQLLRWLGKDFDGVIAFDECHLAKNDAEISATRHVLEYLQSKFPDAAILYVSATAGHQPIHLAYMERLGLWGINCIFESSEAFVNKMKHRKLSGMEVITLELKRIGAFMARQISMKDVNCEVITARLSDQDKELYNDCVHLWQKIYEILNAEEQRIEIDRLDRQRLIYEQTNERRKIPKTQCPRSVLVPLRTHEYWADHQRFFSTLLISFKTPALLQLKQDHPITKFSLVVCLQNTGSNQLQLVQEDLLNAPLRPFSLCWAKLRSVLAKIMIRPAVRNPGESVGLNEADLLLDDQKRQDIRSLFRKIEDRLPRNPVDEFIDVLGGIGAVAEVTGRRKRQRWMKDMNRYMTQPIIDSCETEVERFMNFPKRAAIISQRGSTGINLHDERKKKNSTQRVQVCVQCPWIAENGLQQFGRTNRANQRTSPKFVLLITDVKGEARFYSSFLERIQQLGAITQGDRRAVSLRFDVDCPITDDHAMASKAGLLTVQMMMNKPVVSDDLKRTGLLDQNGPTKSAENIEIFLNRMLGCTIETQDALYTAMTGYFRMLMVQAKNKGQYDDGMKGIGARWRLKWISETKFTLNGDGAALVRLQVDRGLSWLELQLYVIPCFKGKNPTYFANGNEILCGFPVEAMVTELSGECEKQVTHYKLYSPLDSVQVLIVAEKFESTSGWEALGAEQAKRKWTDIYTEGRNGFCAHHFRSEACPNSLSTKCTDGARIFDIFVISRCLLEAWDVVYTCLAEKKIGIQTVQVSCFKDGDNDLYEFVGILVAESAKHDVMEALTFHYNTKQQHQFLDVQNYENEDMLYKKNIFSQKDQSEYKNDALPCFHFNEHCHTDAKNIGEENFTNVKALSLNDTHDQESRCSSGTTTTSSSSSCSSSSCSSSSCSSSSCSSDSSDSD